MKWKIALTTLLLVALSPQTQAAEPAAGTPWTEPNTGIEFVYIPSGCFNMGSRLGTPDATPDERPVHQVCFKQGFYLSKYEVTQAQWKMVMGNNPSDVDRGIGDNYPVNKVSWDDTQRFIQELNVNTGFKFALPSEAQWEYACRAGGSDTYCGGNEVDSVAWYDANSGGKAHRVGSKHANAWGLYDMSGNVWEWVQDTWHGNYSGAPTDGSAWAGGSGSRVLRGGSWYNKPLSARAAYRLINDPAERIENYGCRLARTLP